MRPLGRSVAVINMAETKIEASNIHNHLLAVLPPDEFAKIEPSWRLIDLEVDEVLWEMHEKREHVYFPTTALVCLLYELEDGTSIEVGMTGRQGMVGVVTFVGDSRMAKRAVVEVAGQAYVMQAKDVERFFEEIRDFQDICMSYTQTLIAQISQSAICNRMHSIDQQICRYLLFMGLNVESDTFKMTQKRMSNVLGVRRESISIAAAQLKKLGLIQYGRGKMSILDHKGLLEAACECFEAVKEQYDRILSKYVSDH